MNRFKIFLEDYWECIDARLLVTASLLCMWMLQLVCYSFSFLPSIWIKTWLFPWSLPAGSLACLSLISIFINKKTIKKNTSAIEALSLSSLSVSAILILLFEKESTGCYLGLLFGWLTLPVAGMLLMKQFSRLPFRRRIATTASTVVITAIFSIALLSLPDLAIGAVMVLLPIPVLAISLRGVPPQVSHDKSPTRFCRTIKYDRSFTITITSYGFLAAFMGWADREAILFGSQETVMLAGILAILITLFVTLYMHRRTFIEDPNAAYKPAPLVIGLGFALLPFLPVGQTGISCALVFAGFGQFCMYFWIVIGNHIQKFNWDYKQATLSALAPLFLGLMLGCIASRPASIFTPEPSTAISIIGLFALVVLLWVMAKGEYFANEPGQDPSVFKITPVKKEAIEHDDSISTFISHYGISKRESDVVSLLIKGRNVPYICDELFIAKSTVQTHIKHIYTKTGASNRQDLLNLIEEEREVL